MSEATKQPRSVSRDPQAVESPQSLTDAIVWTIHHPLLVLTGELVVEIVNPAFYRCFEVTPEDTIGRYIYDLGNGQWNIPDLRHLFEEILAERSAVEDYRVEHEFEGIGRRIMILNARHMACGGGDKDRILLAIADMTEAERARFELEGQKEFGEKLIDAIRDPLLVLGWDLRVKSANAPFYETFQVEPDATVGRMVYELGNGQWNIPRLRTLLEDILPDNNAFDDYVVEHDFEHIGHRIMLLNARRLDHLDLIVLAIEDVTARRQSEHHQKVLMGELQHRVKNILMSVRALSQQTRLGSRNLEEYGGVFDGRLNALARTQDLLLKTSDAILLDALLRLELTAAGAREGTTFTLDGPEALLTAQAAQAMAMTVHELTTNAAKYGALNVDNGRIAIAWRIEQRQDQKHLQFVWREHGVALRKQPKRKGFGTEIIEHSLPYLFGGSSALSFHPDGAECIVEIPFPAK